MFEVAQQRDELEKQCSALEDQCAHLQSKLDANQVGPALCAYGHTTRSAVHFPAHLPLFSSAPICRLFHPGNPNGRRQLSLEHLYSPASLAFDSQANNSCLKGS